MNSCILISTQIKEFYDMTLKSIVLIVTLIPISASADVYLSRDICNLDYGSFMSHNGQMRSTLSEQEKQELLGKVKASTDNACLKTKRISDYDDHKDTRARPFKDNCKVLPKKFYSDRKGRTLYRFTNSQMKRLESKMLDDEKLEECLSPLLEF
jgi:hypothetical protein